MAGTEKPSPLFLTLKEMAQKYGHEQTDLFKMDVEGYECGVFDCFQSLEDRKILPMQMLAELHHRATPALFDPNIDWKQEIDSCCLIWVVLLQSAMMIIVVSIAPTRPLILACR